MPHKEQICLFSMSDSVWTDCGLIPVNIPSVTQIANHISVKTFDLKCTFLKQ